MSEVCSFWLWVDRFSIYLFSSYFFPSVLLRCAALYHTGHFSAQSHFAFSLVSKHNHFLEPEPATQFPGFKCQLPHCFELSSLPPSLRSHLLTFMLSLLPVFTFSQSVSESVSKSVSFYLPPSLSLPHSHIAHAPMGKLLSLSMNSVVLLLPLDPKGNIMNNEQKQWKWGVVGGGGERKSSRVRESE